MNLQTCTVFFPLNSVGLTTELISKDYYFWFRILSDIFLRQL